MGCRIRGGEVLFGLLNLLLYMLGLKYIEETQLKIQGGSRFLCLEPRKKACKELYVYSYWHIVGLKPWTLVWDTHARILNELGQLKT